MTFTKYLNKPSSKKITLVEVDTPLRDLIWINYQSGIWQTTIYGTKTIIDDRGNTGYYNYPVDSIPNINSVSIDGKLYAEQTSLANCVNTNESWFIDNGVIYVHFDLWHTPSYFIIKAPGAVIGFTDQIDQTTNNYFEDIYYEPLITGVPNLSKKKDPLFFGLLQYQGGSVAFDNTGGYFDNFSQRDLYGQPVRIYLSFEGLSYSDAKLVYSGKVEDFAHDLTSFKLQISDLRKSLSRKLPVNLLLTDDYSSMDSKLDGTPIPLIFGSVIGIPAYRTSSGNWIFADTTYNNIDSGITVYKKDGTSFSSGGTITDGTFTGTDTTDQLYVDCTQSIITNGLDVLKHLLDKYENIPFTTDNFDTIEWNIEQSGIADVGLWLGKGNLKSVVDIIQNVCTDNQGIFDVLADGRFTFRTFDSDRTPEIEILEDELLDDPSIVYNADEYLSSVKVNHSKNYLEKEYQLVTNDDYETEVFGRYRQYKEKEFDTLLTNRTDAITLSESIMEQSKEIKPTVSLVTKTQNIEIRILDNLIYKLNRQNGKTIIDRSRYQVLGVNIDLSAYETKLIIKQIKTDDKSSIIFNGGDSTTNYDYYDGGDSTSNYDVIDGGNI